MPPKRRAQSPLSTRNTKRRIDSEEDDEGADHGLFDYEDEDESEIIVQNEEAKRWRRKRESSMIELSDFLNLSSSQKYTSVVGCLKWNAFFREKPTNDFAFCTLKDRNNSVIQIVGFGDQATILKNAFEGHDGEVFELLMCGVEADHYLRAKDANAPEVRLLLKGYTEVKLQGTIDEDEPLTPITQLRELLNLSANRIDAKLFTVSPTAETRKGMFHMLLSDGETYIDPFSENERSLKFDGKFYDSPKLENRPFIS